MKQFKSRFVSLYNKMALFSVLTNVVEYKSKQLINDIIKNICT